MAGRAHHLCEIFFFLGKVSKGSFSVSMTLRLKGRVHRPDGQWTGKAGRMGIGHIEIELQTVLTVITKYGDALGPAIDPASKLTVPALHLKDCGGIRPLGVDQNLIIEGAFVIVAGRAEKACPAFVAAGNASHGLVVQFEPFFCGHFPQKHVMPGVLILEALAQVGAVAILSLPENRGKIALFGGVKNARFKRQVIPGDVLELECTLTKRRGPVGIGACTATVNGETACTAELIFAIQ